MTDMHASPISDAASSTFSRAVRGAIDMTDRVTDARTVLEMAKNVVLEIKEATAALLVVMADCLRKA